MLNGFFTKVDYWQSREKPNLMRRNGSYLTKDVDIPPDETELVLSLVNAKYEFA